MQKVLDGRLQFLVIIIVNIATAAARRVLNDYAVGGGTGGCGG